MLERTAVIEEIGAGLQLSPNCSGILREYGVLDRLDGCALMPEALDVRRARDRCNCRPTAAASCAMLSPSRRRALMPEALTSGAPATAPS